MAFLERFSTEDKELLVSLPYRAGLWIIAANGPGSAAQRASERAALETIVTEQGRGRFESGFVYEVMRETCARRSDWESWAEAQDDVLELSERAKTLIAATLSANDLECYRRVVMNIATSMANAFAENAHDEDDFASFPRWAALRLALRQLLARQPPAPRESVSADAGMVVDLTAGAEGSATIVSDFSGTSDSEHLALARLAHALSADSPLPSGRQEP